MFSVTGLLVDFLHVYMKLFYWLLGFSTVEYRDGDVYLRKPWRLYTILVMSISLYARIDRYLSGGPSKVMDSLGLKAIIYTTVKFAETFAALVVLVVDSLMYREYKMIFHKNLLLIDNILQVKHQQYSITRPKIAVFYLIYTVGALFINTIDLFLWKKGVFQLALMLKMCIIDLFLLQFIVDVCFCYCRLQVINASLYESVRAFQVKSKIATDLRRTSFYLESWYDSSISNTVEFSTLIKAYDKMVENLLILRKRYSMPFLCVYGLSFFSFILVVNLFAKNDDSVNFVSPMRVLSVVMWFSHYVIYIVLSCLAVEVVTAESSRTREMLGKINILHIRDSKISTELSQFRYLVERNDLKLSIAGLFPGDLTLFATIVTITASYSIIFVQMS